MPQCIYFMMWRMNVLAAQPTLLLQVGFRGFFLSEFRANCFHNFGCAAYDDSKMPESVCIRVAAIQSLQERPIGHSETLE